MKLNWTIAKIEEIAEVSPRLGKAEIPDDLLVSFVPMPAVGAGDGTIDVSHVRPFSEVKKGFTSFQQGDVLFAKITPCMENGKMAIVPKVENGYAFGSTEFHVLRPKPGIDARYLYYYVSSRRFRGEAEHQMSGAVGQKRVPTQYLRDCTIPLAPRNEQTRIVAEIEKQFSRLDEAVANLKRVKANLKRYKAAVLKAAVEGKLTEEWRRRGDACVARFAGTDQGEACLAPTKPIETGAELLERILAERRKAAGKGRYKEPVGPDTSGLPELPAGWVWVSLESIIINGPQNGLYLPNSSYGSGHPILRINDYQQDWIRPVAELQCVRARPEDIESYSLRVGDIVINRVNSLTHLGKVAVWSGLKQGPVFESNMMRLELASEIVPLYAANYLRSKVGRTRLTKQAKWAVNQASINQKDVCQTPVPLPPLAEQHQIVAEVERRLSIVAEAEAQVDANLRRADRLRQSILKQAFSGQLI